MTCTPETRRFAQPPRMLRVQAQKDAGVFLIPTRAAQAGCDRNTKFLGQVVQDLPALSDRRTALVGAILAFEAPASPADLPHMVAACLAADLSAQPVLIYWHRNRLLHCRELSAETRSILEVLTDKSPDPEQIVRSACQQLLRWYPLPPNANPADVVSWIVNDGVAWLSEQVMRPLIADIVGQQRIEPLPPSVIARASRAAQVSAPEKAARRPAETLEVVSGLIETGLLLNNVKETGSWLIDDLLTAFAERSAKPGKRKRGEADVVVRALSWPAQRLLEAGPAAAFVFAFSLFMLTDGTARTSSGDLDTVRRYTRNLAHDLHRALVRIGVHPLEMEEADWQQLIATLCGPEPPQERRKAVAALLKFIRSHIGAEVRSSAVAPPELRRVRANVIWHHELVAALQILRAVEPDERLRAQVRAIYDIARRAGVRFSEVILLEVRNIHVFKNGTTEYVTVELAACGGKTGAARRSAFLGKAVECAALVEWYERRDKTERAQPDELLFADPHKPERLYRIGRLAQLVHGLLKWASGDAEVSFHTLRHSVLTSELRGLLESDSVAGLGALAEIAARAGHLDPATTLTTYFHVPWRALRLQIDEALKPLMSRGRAVQAWTTTGTAPSRGTSLAVLSALAADHLDEPLPREESGVHDALRADSLTLQQIRHVLKDVSAERTPAEVMSRNSLDELELIRLCVVADRVANELIGGSAAKGLGLEQRGAAQLLQQLAESLKQIPSNFSEPTLPAHSALWSHLGASTQLAQSAVVAWIKCYRAGHIALRRSEEYEPLLRFLLAAKVPRSHLALRVEKATHLATDSQVNEPSRFDRGRRLYQIVAGERDADKEFDAAEARACVQRLFRFEIPVEEVEPRRGRPRCYLVIARRVVARGIETPPAAARMHEVHGAFTAAAVRLILQKQ